MDTKSKILLLVTFLLIVISIVLTYNKYIIKKDYTVIPLAEEGVELE